ncbi:MAG: cupin domain-containing protein [bacterium]|nr:cupin domain-containing protein [bacterium]
MKIIRFDKLEFIPASHEDPKSPGVFKRVLLKKPDLLAGRIEMVNWAKLPAGKSFKPHYHEDMEEVFIILNGTAKIKIDSEEEILNEGDAVVIPMGKVHEMENISDEDVNYIALGVSLEKGGRTVNV